MLFARRESILWLFGLEVVCRLVAQLFEDQCLVFEKLPGLGLEGCSAPGPGATIEDRIRSVQLSAVLLCAALLMVGRLLLTMLEVGEVLIFKSLRGLFLQV